MAHRCSKTKFVYGSCANAPDLEDLPLILTSHVLETCESLEEWEFILHKHNIVADFQNTCCSFSPERYSTCTVQAEKKLLTQERSDASPKDI